MKILLGMTIREFACIFDNFSDTFKPTARAGPDFSISERLP
jgi:hypothetical protein